MTTTFSSVAVVKKEFRFFMGETLMEDAIYTSMIQSVIENEIFFFLMVYTSMLIVRRKGRELQILEIDWYISIPGVRR
jgi:hypothetical protein